MQKPASSRAWGGVGRTLAVLAGALALAGCATESTLVQPTIAGSGSYYTGNGGIYPAGSYYGSGFYGPDFYGSDLYNPNWAGWGWFGGGWPLSIGFGYGWGPGFGFGYGSGFGFGYGSGFNFGFGLTSLYGFTGWPIGWYNAPWYTANLPLLWNCSYRRCFRGHRNHTWHGRGRWRRGRWNHHPVGTKAMAAGSWRLPVDPEVGRAERNAWHASTIRVNGDPAPAAAFAHEHFIRAPLDRQGTWHPLADSPAMSSYATRRAGPGMMEMQMPRASAYMRANTERAALPITAARFAAHMPTVARAMPSGFRAEPAAMPGRAAPMNFAAPAPTMVARPAASTAAGSIRQH